MSAVYEVATQGEEHRECEKGAATEAEVRVAWQAIASYSGLLDSCS